MSSTVVTDQKMKEKPILFSSDMVNVIRKGQKTQTRRPMKPQPREHDHLEFHSDDPEHCEWRNDPPHYYNVDGNQWCCSVCGEGVRFDGNSIYKSPYEIGDLLWVCEAWAEHWYRGEFEHYRYKADGIHPEDHVTWKPSIHMPREVARLFLFVKNIRVEKLHVISEKDAVAEGFRDIEQFRWRWDEIYAKRGLGWTLNPWVWVFELEVK